MCTICVQNIAFMHGHVQKWQGFDLILPQALAFASNNKYDTHALLCLQLHKQGHVFLLTMHALGCLCDQLLYIIFKLPHVYIFPKTCPLNKKGPAWLWHGQRASLQLITSQNATDRNASGLFAKKTSISCLSENITYSLKGAVLSVAWAVWNSSFVRIGHCAEANSRLPSPCGCPGPGQNPEKPVFAFRTITWWLEFKPYVINASGISVGLIMQIF